MVLVLHLVIVGHLLHIGVPLRMVIALHFPDCVLLRVFIAYSCNVIFTGIKLHLLDVLLRLLKLLLLRTSHVLVFRGCGPGGACCVPGGVGRGLTLAASGAIRGAGSGSQMCELGGGSDD